jgi:hypothetical protein
MVMLAGSAMLTASAILFIGILSAAHFSKQPGSTEVAYATAVDQPV